MQEGRGSSPLSSTAQRTKSRLSSRVVNRSGSHPADEALGVNGDGDGRRQERHEPAERHGGGSPCTVTETAAYQVMHPDAGRPRAWWCRSLDGRQRRRPGRGGVVHSMDGRGGLPDGPPSRRRALINTSQCGPRQDRDPGTRRRQRRPGECPRSARPLSMEPNSWTSMLRPGRDLSNVARSSCCAQSGFALFKTAMPRAAYPQLAPFVGIRSRSLPRRLPSSVIL
jgi:hypothetical protein